MIKNIVIAWFIAFLLFGINCFAYSEQNIDSLTNLLSGKNGDKLKISNDIAEILLEKNDSILVEYINEGLSSSKIHSVSEVIRANELLGDFYLKSYKYDQSIKNYNTALSLAKTFEGKAFFTIRIAIVQYEIEEIMESLEYLRQAKSYLLNVENNELWYTAYYYEGLCYFQIDDFELAKQRWLKAQKYSKNLNSSFYTAQINAMLGEVNLFQNNYLASLNYLNTSILSLRNDTITESYATALQNLGHLYALNQNYREADQYFHASATIFDVLGNKKSYARLLTEIGTIDLLEDNIRDAYLNFSQAVKLFSITGSKKGLALAHTGLAKSLRRNGDLNQAKTSLQKAEKYSNGNFSDLLIAKINLEYGNWYFIKQTYNKALNHAEKALTLLKKSNNYFELSSCYKLISDINYAKKDFKRAADQLRNSSEINQLIHEIINSQEYKFLQSQYEVERKQSVIEVLTQEKEYRDKTLLQNKELIEKQKAFIILGIIIFAFLLIFAFVLASWLNLKRIANKKLQKSNSQIAQQKEEIEIQKQHLQDANTELERLSIIARETDNAVKIMNPVGRIVWVNEGYTRLYGYTLAELQNIEHMNLLGSDSSVDINSLVSVWYGDKKPITYETLNEKKNGTKIWVQTTLTPVLDETGKISKMIAIDTDISRIKKAEASIRIKNRDITSSISYAKKIQEAIMVPFDKFSEYFEESFCFYKPKSIVSGDFYWFSEQHDRIVIACADSTGHGVPGAFMSLIGISFLNKIVNEKGFVAPAIILNRMRNNIITHLHHSQSDNDPIAGDGMDMSVISIDRKNNTLEFAGAMNPVYIIRKGDLIVLKPDRMPVGFFDNEERPFSSTSISLKPGDHIYMFTDGYYDQFGGHDDSKLKTTRFKKLLTSCYGKKSDEQKQIIIDYFNTWRGHNTQVDDILVMGIVID